MAAVSRTDSWDAAWTLTADTHRKRLSDNIFDAYPFLDFMFKNDNVEIEKGGRIIREDLLYGTNTAEFYSGYDVLSTSAVDSVTAAFYNWRYAAVPITINQQEEQQNRRREDAVSLLLAKTEQSMLSLRDQINASLFSSQSGKSCLGLQDLVADSSGTTLAGINSSNETWWENKRDTTSTDFDSVSNNIYAGPALMGTLFNNSSEGNETPNYLVSTLTFYGEYEKILESTGYTRFQANQGTPGLNAQNATFRGIPFTYDRDCPSGHLYMLNTRYLKLKIMEGQNFAKSPFRHNTNQLARVAFITVGLNLITNNRRRQGVLTALT